MTEFIFTPLLLGQCSCPYVSRILVQPMQSNFVFIRCTVVTWSARSFARHKSVSFKLVPGWTDRAQQCGSYWYWYMENVVLFPRVNVVTRYQGGSRRWRWVPSCEYSCDALGLTSTWSVGSVAICISVPGDGSSCPRGGSDPGVRGGPRGFSDPAGFVSMLRRAGNRGDGGH